ncbi:MAG: AroB-related putative sugar phosphate phospholyase (cyclizing) [Deferribacterales bacterium]
MKIDVKSNIKNYSIEFHDDFGFLKSFAELNNAVYIIDRKVYDIYSSHFSKIEQSDLFLLDAVEENKSLDYVQKIYDFLTSKAVKRNITIVSVGGGITQDITGFVASTLYRGVNWIFAPTTFLAITDSCLGSKTSLNYKSHKNLIGTFYPPSRIHICHKFIETLDRVDFYSGVGEAVKLQLLKEENNKSLNDVRSRIYEIIEKPEKRLDWICDNLSVKLSYMEDDEFDLGRRNLLNYGHCFGHALEATSVYDVPHGIAVTIGMIFANRLAVNRGIFSEDKCSYIEQEILKPCVPISVDQAYLDTDAIFEAMKSDKKRTGEFLAVVIPDNSYNFIKLENVRYEELEPCINVIKHIL